MLARFTSHPLRNYADSNFSIFDEFMEGVFDSKNNGSLPYNTIVLNENHSIVEIAMAGFSKDDIVVELFNDTLKVFSKAQDGTQAKAQMQAPENEKAQYPYYLHRGIAKRSFNYTFSIAKAYEVTDVILKDGMLTINLEKQRVEVEKPKQLKIK